MQLMIFWGDCSSNVIILEGVEIKLVDFEGVWSHFIKIWGRQKISSKKFTNWGKKVFVPIKWEEVTYLQRHGVFDKSNLGLQSLKSVKSHTYGGG